MSPRQRMGKDPFEKLTEQTPADKGKSAPAAKTARKTEKNPVPPQLEELRQEIKQLSQALAGQQLEIQEIRDQLDQLARRGDHASLFIGNPWRFWFPFLFR